MEEVSQKEKCDLLEVYSENDKFKIMKNENYDFTGFLQYNDYQENDNFVNFTSNVDIAEFEEQENKNAEIQSENYVEILMSSDDELDEHDENLKSPDKIKFKQTSNNNDNVEKIFAKFGDINIDDI